MDVIIPNRDIAASNVVKLDSSDVIVLPIDVCRRAAAIPDLILFDDEMLATR